jgi:ABC-type antimicrobial peptide transport system permease subunit
VILGTVAVAVAVAVLASAAASYFISKVQPAQVLRSE